VSDVSLIQIPLGGGLDETNEDSDVPGDKMRVCQNVVFPDAVNATKRRGLKALGSALTNAVKIIDGGGEVLAIDGQQAWAYVPATDSYVSRGPVSPCTASRALLASGNSTDFASPVVPLGSQSEDPVTKLRVYAWCDGIAIQASVWDTVNQTYVVTETELNPAAQDNSGLDGCRPRVVIFGGYAYVLYPIANSGPGQMRYRSIQLATPGAGFAAEATLPVGGASQDIQSTDAWDACVCYLSGSLAPALAYAAMQAGSAPGQSVTVNVFTGAAGVLTSVGIQLQGNPPDGVTSVAIASTPSTEAATQIFVIAGSFLGGATEQYTTARTAMTPNAAANPTILQPLATFIFNTETVANATQTSQMYRGIGIVRNGLGTGTTAQWLVTFSTDYRIASRQAGIAVASADHRACTALWSALVQSVGAGGFPTRGPFIGYQTQSKPVAYTWNGVTRFFVLAQYQDGQRAANGSLSIGVTPNVQAGSQGLCLLQVDGLTHSPPTWLAPIPCAVAAPRFAGNAYAGNAEVVLTSDGSGFSCVGTEQDVSNATSLSALRFNFNDPALWQTVRLGSWTWIAGGLPMQYDGSLLHEAGFITAPMAPVVGFPAPGGAVIPAITTLTYILMYVQQDALGNIHRSPPSAPLIVNSTAGFASAQLGIVTCAITLRQQAGPSAGIVGAHPIRIEIYRNNSGAGLTVFQLIASIPNDPTAATITYSDMTPDAAGVSTAPLLPTTGGAVSSDGPPSLVGLAVHADRVFGISEDGQTAYFTTALTRAESPRFTDAFTITWPTGPIVMQWSLEQRLHGATSDRIYYVFGDGPNDNGAGSDLTLPSIWQAAFGVVDPRAFCLFTEGAIFLSQRGLYLEGRDGSFPWLPQCRRTLAANPAITSIVALDNDGAIRISMQQVDGPASNTNPGVVIHFDYRHGKWAQHIPFGSSIGMLSTCVSAGTFYGLESINFGGGVVEGVLAKEDATSFHDTALGGGVDYVQSVLTTGWADVAGEQGSARIQRVMFLGQSYTPHGLTIETARDYSPAFDADLGTWSDSDVSAMTLEQMRHTPTQQKCMAMSVRVTDTAPTVGAIGTGQGPTLRQLLLRARSRRGEWKRTTVGQQR
jgi:hypothetical protein